MHKNTFFDQDLSMRVNLDELRHQEYITRLCEQVMQGEIDLNMLSFSDLIEINSYLEEEVKRKEAMLATKREELRVHRMRLSAISETGSPTE